MDVLNWQSGPFVCGCLSLMFVHVLPAQCQAMKEYIASDRHHVHFWSVIDLAANTPQVCLAIEAIKLYGRMCLCLS